MTHCKMNRRPVARLAILGALAAAICLGGAAGCSAPTPRLVSSGEGPQVYQIGLSASNVFVVRAKGGRPILVDCGSPGDLEDIEEALRSLGASVGDVKLVILTHGHGDHAANGKALQARGVKVAAGEAEAVMTEQGHNDDLKPTSNFAKVLKPFIDYTYPPYTPDVAIPTGGIPLEPYGISGTAFEMPGHTPGSVVVRLGAREALVGDVMLGGSLGGAISPGEAGEHYYQADVEKNRANLKALLRMGIETFYLGHGGPVTRAAVLEGFGWDPVTLEDLPARRRVRGTR